MLFIILLNFAFQLFDRFLLLFTPIVEAYDSIYVAITGLSVPLIFWDIIALCKFFLPMGTIIVLIQITIFIIAFKIIVSLFHVFTGGLLFDF